MNGYTLIDTCPDDKELCKALGNKYVKPKFHMWFVWKNDED